MYRWPPSPTSTPRLIRAQPSDTSCPSELDNPWRASHYSEGPIGSPQPRPQPVESDSEYQWKRPESLRDRSLSFSLSDSHPASGRNSPNKDGSYNLGTSHLHDEYDRLFGYPSEFLASLLCPQQAMCHQKFELLVDDLAFIGHPVCAEADGVWRFKPEKFKDSVRGRESRNRDSSHEGVSASPSRSPATESPPASCSAWLQTFHLVLVLDVPDPSSSASGNVSKYFDIIYEQIAFTATAVLFQEQVLSNFVETECDTLGSLKDSCISKGVYNLNMYVNSLTLGPQEILSRTLYPRHLKFLLLRPP